ncbi:S4 domain-containing protein, partial [Streptomyces sp. NPDC004069]
MDVPGDGTPDRVGPRERADGRRRFGRGSARQMVVHGHIQVNGKKVDKPSFQ